MSQSTPAGILDDYPGAAAAYSLRLLNTDYTGDAVTVRRASDNTTTNIGFVDGELDVDALNTFCSGTDGFVTVWFDQSGNGNDAANTTASEQPKIFDSVDGVILENGKAAIEFGSSISLRSAFDSSIYPISGFITFKGQVGRFLFDDDNDINTNSLVILNSTDIRLYNASGANIVHTISDDFTTQHLASFIVDSTNSQIGIDSDFTTGTMGVDSLSGVTLLNNANGTLGTNGTIQEAIIYPTSQSSNRTGIEANINDFYSIY